MATKRKFDAVTPRPKYNERGAVWWHKIGSAVENDKGQITIFLNSIPIPGDEGDVRIHLFEQKEDEERAPKERVRQPHHKKDALDDDHIPF